MLLHVQDKYVQNVQDMRYIYTHLHWVLCSKRCLIDHDSTKESESVNEDGSDDETEVTDGVWMKYEDFRKAFSWVHNLNSTNGLMLHYLYYVLYIELWSYLPQIPTSNTHTATKIWLWGDNIFRLSSLLSPTLPTGYSGECTRRTKGKGTCITLTCYQGTYIQES